MPARAEGRRVLVVCDFYAKYATQLARGLADVGADVALLTRDHDLEFGGESGRRDPGALRRYVAEVLGHGGRHLQLPGRASDPQRLIAFARVHRCVRAFAPDVVHVQAGAWNDPRLLVAAGKWPSRCAVTIHDPEFHPGDEPEGRLHRIERRWIMRRAGLIFVHSERLRDELLEAWPTSAPVVVVPHGTQSPTPSPVPPEPVMLCFGRMSHYKGVDVLLDALPAVWQAVPDARLILAGAGTLPAHRLLEDARVQVRREHIPESDVRPLFEAARTVVLPYRQASQSGVGSQAKTYGRSLVVTAVGGLAELVADGSGEVVAPEDPAALAGGIVRVLRTPGLAEQMARSAADGARASSWPNVARQTLVAYDEHLLATSASRRR